jgi:formate-dependent nitrite reductase membrane component NrfD
MTFQQKDSLCFYYRLYITYTLTLRISICQSDMVMVVTMLYLLKLFRHLPKAYLKQDTILRSVGSFIILLLIMRITVGSLLNQGLE